MSSRPACWSRITPSRSRWTAKAALVEGTLEAKELSEANVAHLKQDGDDTLEGDGPRKEFFLHATAVELSANS